MPLPIVLIAPLHYLLIALYLVAPIVAVARAIRLARQEKPGALVSAVSVFFVGSLLGVGLCFAYAHLGDASMMPGQVALTSYLSASLIFILRGLNGAVGNLLAKLGPAGTFLRAILVTCLALPWIMAAAMVYRPKVRPTLTPVSFANWHYEPATFPATDGSRVSAYYIPAERPRGGGVVAEDHGTHTVIVVHGLGSNKGNALMLARYLVPAGYNVLSLDLRAHGESGGQFTGIGSTEHQDVLGALAWLKANKPDEAEHVYGLGASQGAAALLSAAADPRGDGIEAVAVLGTFADLSSLMTSITRDRFPGPLGTLLRTIAFPLAEAHSGAPLRQFSPAAAAAKLWPRPLLIIHGTKDEIISVNQAHQLFNAASLPKEVRYLDGTHNSILGSDEVGRMVLEFFRSAKALPIT